MKKVYGNTGGLKSNQLKRLENVYRRKVPPEQIATFEITREISLLSHEIGRQIGILIDRSGKIAHVIVGDQQKIFIPDLSDYRVAPGRLRGLRCIHTHLNKEPLSSDDLTDLALLSLDAMAAVTYSKDGRPEKVYVSHILPGSSARPYQLLEPLDPHLLDIGCLGLIQSIEAELAKKRQSLHLDQKRERALLISVTSAPKSIAEDSLAELKELTKTSGIYVAGTILQQRQKINPRFLMGRGKLQELVILALQNFASLLIFDQELNPSQIRSITDATELKVIDRTQLILDIFAQRAQTREGKLQVELAQLKYLLPRLVTKNTAMSRLTGGIGGRGPGETKLEINRRRVRDRITRLENSLDSVKKQRRQQRSLRGKKGLPIISIIGYTNAGKSTLLNTLTHSDVIAEKKLFATLDPSSRRLRFPRDIEVIITDTVGFIKDLPEDLKVAFRATLEELESADLLLHVIDISNPRFEDQIESVEKILEELDLESLPMIRVLNKKDLLDQSMVEHLEKSFGGIAVSARDASTLIPLTEKMMQWSENLAEISVN
ncbi:MAG: GTPase HflX [Desulfobacterales bacterium]